MKKALAMKCTQEQWDLIKGRIPEEIETSIYGGFKENDYITNHWGGNLQISNCKRSHSRIKFCEIHETFSAKIFLNACGVETDVIAKLLEEKTRL